MMPGKGKTIVTGNLRDVMKESISAAASYVHSRAVDFGIEPPLFDRRDIHLHVPEGRGAQGRPLGRRRHGDRNCLGDDRHSGAP
jgi:ATP-dependent Lon protease